MRIIFPAVFLVLVLCAGNILAQESIYWVEFRDKGIPESDFSPSSAVYQKTLKLFTPDALVKRKKLAAEGIIKDIITIEDAPVCGRYIDSLKHIGLTVRAITRWQNAVSISMTDTLFHFVSSLPFVKKVTPLIIDGKRRAESEVSPFVKNFPRDQYESSSIQSLPDPAGYDNIIYHYGGSASQIKRIGAMPLHAMGIDATGVRLGFLDTGFRWHAMRTTKDRHIKEEYDFVFGDSTVSNQSNDVGDQDGHGSAVLSSAVGYLIDSVVGPAYNADVYLAKTEDLRSETPREEENYASALEWMEARGVDITSSSLGYLNYDSGYTSITYSELDGKTTISSRACSRAAKLGMLVVSAMGNNGKTGDPYLSTPADADSIISVGALDVNDSIAAFSSRGPTADGRLKPEIIAPGVNVWTMSAIDSQVYQGGTSLATPLVSSSCALIMQAHPEASAQAIRRAVMRTGSRAATPDTAYGYGTLNAYAAALELGTVIGPHRIWRQDSIHTVEVGLAANNGIKNPRITYALNVGGQFAEHLPLSLVTDSLIYAASFPPLRKGTHVRFYIETFDGADTVTRSPRNAPDSVYDFYVGDSIPSPPFKVRILSENTELHIVPNPATDHVDISYDIAEPIHFVMSDAIGREVRSFTTQRGVKDLRLDLGNTPPGVYTLLGLGEEKVPLIYSKLVLLR